MKSIIVVPCYNEAKRLQKEAFVSYVQQNADIDFLFVNDGSSDNTLQVLEALCATDPHLHLLNLQPHGGKAEAVRKGMLHASQNFSAEVVGFWDADLATPLNEIKDFVAWLEKGYDAVLGLRLMRLGAEVKRRKLRHYLGRTFATCASMILHLPVYDTQCGAKLFRSSVVSPLCTTPFLTRWLFDVELLARYRNAYGIEAACNKVYEYPLFHWIDVEGSQLKSRDFVKAPMELMKIRKQYNRRK